MVTENLFTNIELVSIVVRDQQEALDWYRDKLDFEVRDDQEMDEMEGRWLTIGVPDQDDLMVALEPLDWGLSGDPSEKEAVIGSNGLSLRTEDIGATLEELERRGVEITYGPESAPWGTYALIADLYGNQHHIREPAGQE